MNTNLLLLAVAVVVIVAVVLQLKTARTFPYVKAEVIWLKEEKPALSFPI